jgi:hypothetical protein
MVNVPGGTSNTFNIMYSEFLCVVHYHTFPCKGLENVLTEYVHFLADPY